MKRIVIAGGGTGGHFYPGFVLGQALREKGWELLFAVRRTDPAIETLQREDLPYLELDVIGMPRAFSPRLASFVLGLLRGERLAYRALRAFAPSCVVGTGGYVSFPAVFAGWRLGVPCLLHESNAQLGLANRACLPFANELAMGLPLERRPSWPQGVHYEPCGTPVRAEFAQLREAGQARKALGLDPSRRTLLVFGGSQGARGINQRVPPAVNLLMSKRPEIQCLHLSGAKEERDVLKLYNGKATVLPYLREMHNAFAAADLVLCRAGASTVAELIAAKKPSVLVPLPTSAGGHQDANARALASVGAAVILKESEIDASSLAARLEDLLFSPKAADFGRLGLPPPDQCIARLVARVETLSANR